MMKDVIAKIWTVSLALMTGVAVCRECLAADEACGDMFLLSWTANRTCNKNYSTFNGSGSHDPHYARGTLLPLIRMERPETHDGSTNTR